jgi:hypothetical protein
MGLGGLEPPTHGLGNIWGLGLALQAVLCFLMAFIASVLMVWYVVPL